MTLTRMAFFKLLAAVGIGQGIANAPVSVQCLEAGPGKKTWVWTKCDCAEGEERCPLGHCQKPHTLVHIVHDLKNGGEGFAVTSWRTTDVEYIAPSICSTCGIVYVPPAEAKS